jgi:ClpP class serine protease
VGTRTLDSSRLDELTDGRILTGVRATRYGLADQTGGIREAFAVAKGLAGVDAARLIKYYPEGSERPRSAYASSGAQPPGEGGTEVNLVQIRAGDLGPLSGASYAGAYYLWIPPG